VKERVISALTESARVKTECLNDVEPVLEAARLIAASFTEGGRLYLFGNGGSAADAQHLAAEFVNRFQIERPPLPAVALTVDTSILTSIANDYNFDDVFVKQIKALGRENDVALGLTTSGHSRNVVAALSAAKNNGLKTVALTGQDGGEARVWADVLLAAPTQSTPRVQEIHITWGHIICDLVDYILFRRPAEHLE
jgi:D-sedoheptulose 7-phosphate isomerase